MTPEEFKRWRVSVGTQADVSEIIHRDVRRIRAYESGDESIPPIVACLVRYIDKYGYPP